MFIKINLLLSLFISILFISCSNYKATDPLSSSEYRYDLYSIPENVDTKYLIKADTKETDIETIMQQYYDEYGSYIIFLQDTKDNIDSSNTIDTINTIIKKDKYSRGVALDLSRTDMTAIKDNAFNANKNLANVKLPSTITTIGTAAFTSCVNLRSINFPSSITVINEEAFKSCTMLSSANLQQTKITEINPQTFYDCSNLKYVLFPSTLLAVQSSAFNYCISLTTITFPENFIGIANEGFANCKALKNISLNNKLEDIYGMAFYNCSSLEKISLPASLTSIGNNTFSGCISLKSVEYLGDSSTAINASASSTDLFGAYSTAPASTPSSLYLPKALDISTGWDNFLGYNWKDTDRNIYKESMP